MYDFNKLERAVNSLNAVQNDNDIEEKIRIAKIAQGTRITEAFCDICEFAIKMKEILPDDFSFSHKYSGYCSLTIRYEKGVLSWYAHDSDHVTTSIVFKEEGAKGMLQCSEQVKGYLIDFYNNWEAFLCYGCKEIEGKSFMDLCVDEINKMAKKISDEQNSKLKCYLL